MSFDMRNFLSFKVFSREVWVLGLAWILFKTINFNSYTTFFSSSDGAGIINESPFVAGIACGTMLAAFVIGVVSWRGKLQHWRLNYQVPLALLAMVYAIFLVSGNTLSSDVSYRLYFFFGVIYSSSSVMIALVLIELFVAQKSLVAVAFQLAAGKILSSLMRLALDEVGSQGAQVICLLCLAVCFLSIRYLRARMNPCEFDFSKGWFKRAFNNVYLIYFVVAALSIVASVVGIFGTTEQGGSLATPTITVLTAFLCGVVFLGMTVWAKQIPSPSFAFTVIVPLLLVVLLMVPFLNQSYGFALGTIIFGGQSLVSLFAVYAYIETYTKFGTPVYAFAAFIYGTDKVFALVGLGLGGFINTLPEENNFIITSIVSAVSIYILVFTLLVYLHKVRSKEKAALEEVKLQNEALLEAAAEIRGLESEKLERKDPFAERVLELSALHSLTKREEEILEQLARGRTTTNIGESLFLSPNTVRTYKKGVYAKLGVHSRKELLDLFDVEVK